MPGDPWRLEDVRLSPEICRLFDHFPGLHFFVKDRDARLIHCNTTHRHNLFRFEEPHALYGKGNYHFFPNALAEAFAEDDRKVMASGESILDRIELNITHEGKLTWFCTSKAPLRNGRGEIVGLVGISRQLDEADRRLGRFELLKPAIEYIQNRYIGEVQVADLARICHMSPAQFNREFNQFFRISPIQFILRLRIHAACLRLTSGDETIGVVGAHCGFEDQNYFARQFKRIIGMTPTEFRRRHCPPQT